MQLSPIAARVAFVIHLEGSESTPADLARIQHVVHLFRGYHLRATWTVASCQSLERMQHLGLLAGTEELAIAISTSEAALPTFREILRKRLSAIHGCTTASVGLAAGESLALRSHAACLGEQNLRGLLSNNLRRPTGRTQTPLPCGLWQLDHAIAIPQKSWLSQLLPGGGVLHRLNTLVAKDQTIIISVDALRLAHASTRSIQSLERLLREVSHSASREEIEITTAGQIVAELTAHRVARPQHSILRAA